MCALLLFVVLTLAGCGSDPGDSEDMVVLRDALVSKIRSLDPGDVSDTTSATVTGCFYETLYGFDYEARPYKLVPMLADSMPEISDDRLTYTIKLKEGIKFSDSPCFPDGKGRELKASDFVFAWKRIANIKFRSKNWWMFDGRIVGLDAFREYTTEVGKGEEVDYSRPVEGFKAVDDHTLVIKLKKPWPQLPLVLAYLASAPVPPEAVDYYGEDIVSNPVGTGPFVLKHWQRGSYVEALKNPNFRTEYNPGASRTAENKLPLADKILFMVVEESQPRWLQFKQGDIDALTPPADNFDQAIEIGHELTPQMKKNNIQLTTMDEPCTDWVALNMEDPLIGGNKPLRLALAHAVDRKKYIELFTNNRDEPAYGFIPPVMKAYDPGIKEIGPHYDPDKAREYLEQAREVQGGEIPTITLTMGGTSSLHSKMGTLLERNFEAIGLDIETEYLDWPIFLEKTHTKSAQIFQLGWRADYPDTETFLQVFYSKNESPGPNQFNYSSPEFDRIYEEATMMPAGPERTELYRQAERIVMEDCPMIPIKHRVMYSLYHDWLENYRLAAFDPGYGLRKYRSADMDKRKKF
ncbi:ABC transporter substrate-binding protein [Anaerohalosphaera lusitana]|uniref:ABC transporter substrate-binding protein n=1 Tax=Anaerohalosphaera lusitana TaxID=1936003 RepID=UPI0011BA5CD0|nr:ABC transporter substrate-binding protein [Anaerohalosphaera lusitana]